MTTPSSSDVGEASEQQQHAEDCTSFAKLSIADDDAVEPDVVDDAPPPPPLPAGWVEEEDAYSKVPFYINTVKGETTWVRPVADSTTGTADAGDSLVEGGSSGASENNDHTEAAVAPLLAGWIEEKDAFSGEVYYMHPEKGETTWKRPTA